MDTEMDVDMGMDHLAMSTPGHGAFNAKEGFPLTIVPPWADFQQPMETHFNGDRLAVFRQAQELESCANGDEHWLKSLEVFMILERLAASLRAASKTRRQLSCSRADFGPWLRRDPTASLFTKNTRSKCFSGRIAIHTHHPLLAYYCSGAFSHDRNGGPT